MKPFPRTSQELDAALADIKSQGASQSDINAFIHEYKRRTGAPEQAPISSAPFQVDPEKETYLSNTLKTLGNFIPSALGFAKNVVKSTVYDMPKEAITQGIKAFSDPGVPGDSIFDTTIGTLKNVPKTAYDLFVPEGAKKLFSGDLQGAQKLIAEDPVGQVAPFVFGVKGLADTVGKGKVVDSAVRKATAPVAEPMRAISGQAGNIGRAATSQVTGLQSDTIRQLMSDPQSLQKVIKRGTDRYTIAEEVQGALQKKLAGMDEQVAGFTPRAFADEIKNSLDRRIAELSETGKGYDPFRANKGLDKPLVKVQPNWLSDTLKKTAGVTIDEAGKIQVNTTGRIRSAQDARALQNLYDLWEPQFKAEALTAEEFLNFRQDLSKLSKFERDIGKSNDLESVAKSVRHSLNENYRGQIKGLDKIDESFAKQSAELGELRQGLIDSDGNLNESAIGKIARSPKNDLLSQRLEKISPGITARIRFLNDILESKRELAKNILDKDGNLTDAAVDRIAKSGGKDIFSQKLEELAPGVTDRIRLLKAVEDIAQAKVQKIQFGGSAALSYLVNPAFIVASIMSIPAIAVPILKALGFAGREITAITNNLNIPLSMLAAPGDEEAIQNNRTPAVTPGQAPRSTMGASLTGSGQSMASQSNTTE